MPLRDFLREYQHGSKQALVLGKGPSYRPPSDQERQVNLVVSLNHGCRDTHVHLAHCIDVDVVDALGSKLLEQADAVVMPYHPHIGWKPGSLTLDYLAQKHPVLSQFAERGALYGYNLFTTRARHGQSHVIRARYFSAEAVVDLLGYLGIKEIATLGVDGGHEQAGAFHDLTNHNKERGYDQQWTGIRKAISRHRINYHPMGVESPIRVFVGAGPAQEVPALVLKHSIERHCTMSVEVLPMIGWEPPQPQHPHNRQRTPFSFQRFMIPAYCQYQGHAIYLDSDMLVFADIRQVWEAKSTRPILAMRHDDIDKHKAKFSVLRIDCGEARIEIERLIDLLDRDMMSYEDIVFNFDIGLEVQDGWDPEWNSLEAYTRGVTKLLHYTEMYNQPWLRNPAHPLGHLWFAELKTAVLDGSISGILVADHVKRGWILPRCLEVLDEKP